MKGTGIIRRVDDLGRVVIPKEIRRVLKIREGDPLEIYTNGDSVIYRKYYPIDRISTLAYQYAEVLDEMTSHSVVITDRDRVVTVAGVSKKDFLERGISEELDNIVSNFDTYQYNKNCIIHPIPELEHIASYVYPIMSKGEVFGSLILLADDKAKEPSETDIKLAQNTAKMLASQLEV